ncbi:MAG: response regulator [Elusimicrobia bacterium]|nr:response regulator [Elusimicrobiota bacterium]
MALILIADDNIAIASVLKDYLTSRGHQVATVHDGMSVSLKAQEIHPHLIIMDIQMPGTYGTTAYKTLEAAGVAQRTPVIFVTSVILEKARMIVPETPLTRLMGKPIDLARLEATIAELTAARPA